MKRPNTSPKLHTVIIEFGSGIPSAQLHFTDPERAGKALRALISKMNAGAKHQIIESLQLWHQGALISTYRANPPPTVWLPPPDSDGVRRIPEAGKRRGKGPPRLPSTISTSPNSPLRSGCVTGTNGKRKLVL